MKHTTVPKAEDSLDYIEALLEAEHAALQDTLSNDISDDEVSEIHDEINANRGAKEYLRTAKLRSNYANLIEMKMVDNNTIH